MEPTRPEMKTPEKKTAEKTTSNPTMRPGFERDGQEPPELKEYTYMVNEIPITAQLTEEQAEQLNAVPVEGSSEGEEGDQGDVTDKARRARGMKR